MNFASLMGISAALLTTIAFVPQSIKTLRSRETEGISTLMYLLFVIGVSAWLAYGLLIQDLAIVIANIFTFLFAAPVLVVTMTQRKRR